MDRSLTLKQISKETIEKLKSDSELLSIYLRNSSDNILIYILEKLGKLNHTTDENIFLELLHKQKDKIRTLAIKNLAKLENLDLLPVFIKYAKSDTSSIVRREAVSAIGRLRNPITIPVLSCFLTDIDPKVVMQAIRGLLVFSKREEVKIELKKLINHPNELVQEIVRKELIGSSINVTFTDKQDVCPSFLKNTVVHGDVLEIVKHVPDESIHLTFTSPPYYNARDYSVYQSYEEYLCFLSSVFKEVHRITKEGRFFILNTSPIIIPRISRAHSSKRYPIPFDIHPYLIKLGWEFIDDIVWVKPEACVKNRNAGFLQHRKPLAYKPNAITEFIMVYRKKTDRLIDWNIKQYNFDKINKSRIVEDYETSNVWKIEPASDPVHSAVFPVELCNRVIKLYSYIDDLIFDPFAGSGTLGKAAINLNRFFFMTEKEKIYIDRIKEELFTGCDLYSCRELKAKFVDSSIFMTMVGDKI